MTEAHRPASRGSEDKQMVQDVDSFLEMAQAGGLLFDEDLANEVKRGGARLVEWWIASLKWSEHATEDDKALVAGNLRTFWNWLHTNSRGRILAEQAPVSERGTSEAVIVPPLNPTSAMLEAGAQRLVSWEEGCKWPESWTPLQVAAARNEAERVWRSMWLVANGLGNGPHEPPRPPNHFPVA